VDELEAELRTLDREIARFVLEAFRREGPDALRDQLAAAMAESLRPLQRTLEALDAALADTRGDLAQSAEAGEAAAERRAVALHQAISRLRAAPPASAAPTAEPGPDELQPDLFGDHPPAQRYREPPRTRAPEAAPGQGGLRRRHLAFVAAGGLALVVAAGAAVWVLNPAGLPGLGPRPAAVAGAAPAAGGEPATGPAAASPDQEGFARVLGQVALWSGERRKAALEALCGPGADIAGCPDMDRRWAPGARTRKEADAALAVAVAALGEADGCAPLAGPAAAAGKREPASAPAPAGDPEAALRCLLTEAGRAPRP
jgi:hypothetical protein